VIETLADASTFLVFPLTIAELLQGLDMVDMLR